MKDLDEIPQLHLRSPSEVMRLARMGAMFPTRLSFLRSLIRDLAAEPTKIARPVWEIDDIGTGHAVYSLALKGVPYSLVATARDLPADQRSDRVIATAWDSSFVLFDGVPDAQEIKRICETAPQQEAARFTEKDLVLSRANKSTRLFSHVVNRLRSGLQPDIKMVRDIGYLMRTTAVYGNGKFGIADRVAYDDRPGMDGPFRAEMLAVYLIRLFTHDLVEHLGRAPLDRKIKRHLGIGNATGLGMAPFLVTHPVLLNNWMLVRETALARVCAQKRITDNEITRLQDLHRRASGHLLEWNVTDTTHQSRIGVLRRDWCAFAGKMQRVDLCGDYPLKQLMQNVQSYSPDVQELAVAMIIEPFGHLVDGLVDCMADPLGAMPSQMHTTGEIHDAIEQRFKWVLEIDFEAPETRRRFWYVSACKQEPRLGDRYGEVDATLESPLDIAFRIRKLADSLTARNQTVATFLRKYPEHTLAVERVGLADMYPYAEIQDNLTDAACLPIDMLRCKLAFFGAAKFDPKSDLWTRITLCQGAPLADELDERADDWWLPPFEM